MKSSIHAIADTKLALALPVVWLPILAAAAVLSVSTELSLVDDIWCATATGMTGRGGPLEFVLHAFFSPEPDRYRWFWELEQDIRWTILGDAPGAHHFVMLLYRVTTALLASRILYEFHLEPSSRVALAAPVAYGFFFPIVPEARLGLQEPLAAMFLLISTLFVVRLLVRWTGNINTMPRKEKLLIVLSFLLFSGTKENMVVAGAGIVLAYLSIQLRARSYAPILTCTLIAILIVWILRVSAVAASARYASDQSNLDAFNAGWLWWRWKMEAKDLLAAKSELNWLSVLISASFVAAVAYIVLKARDLRNSRSGAALILVLVLLIAQLAVTAKLDDVPRYASPSVWLAAIIFGVGVHAIGNTLRAFGPGVSFSICILVSLGMTTAFLWHFSSQQRNTAVVHQMLTALTDLADDRGENNVVVFGASPFHPWWTLRRSEPIWQVQQFLSNYRPRFNRKAAVQTTPVEIWVSQAGATGTSFLLANHPSELIQEELGRNIKLAEERSFCTGRTIEVSGFSYEDLRSVGQSIGLSRGKESAWRDAGSPAGDPGEVDCWYIWQLPPASTFRE